GLVGAAVWALTMMIVDACGRRRFRTAALGWFCLLWACYAYVHGSWLPRTDSYRQETALLRRLPELVQSGTDIYSYRLRQSGDFLRSGSARFDGPLYIHLSRECYYSGLPVKALWRLDDLKVSGDDPVYVLTLNEYSEDLESRGLTYLPHAAVQDSWPPLRRFCRLFVLDPKQVRLAVTRLPVAAGKDGDLGWP